jgi:hypothetical protein
MRQAQLRILNKAGVNPVVVDGKCCIKVTNRNEIMPTLHALEDAKLVASPYKVDECLYEITDVENVGVK